MRKYFVYILLISFTLFLSSCFNNEQVNTTFNITYIVEGERVNLTPSTFEFINETLLPIYEKEGYIFVGWSFNEDLSGEVINKLNAGFNEDQTLYAKLLKAHTLTLNFNGGEVIEYKDVFHKEEEVKLPLNINKEGYKFAGWYIDENFTGEPLTKVNIGTDTNISLYARYLKYNTLTLNFNGGEEVDYLMYFTSEEEVILPSNIYKEGSEFLGWYLDPSFNGERVTKIEINTNEDITLYAKFSSESYTLYLDFNGGDVVTYNNVINNGIDITLPLDVIKEHYEFTGWYLNKHKIGERYYFVDQDTKSDITLYATFDISDDVFNYVNMPNEQDLITNNISLDNYILNDKFYVTFDNQNLSIVDNEGTLRRPYTEQELTLTVKVTDYTNEIVKDYNYIVAGYKSLSAPIRSGYIYSEYYNVDDYYFLNQEIVYAAFSLADSNGNFTSNDNIGYFGRVNANLMPKAKELGVRVIMSVGPSSEWREFSKTPEKRLNFANNIVELINQHGFDGVDIDWETPRASYGENTYYVELMKIVYQKVKSNNPHHLVTTAIAGGSSQGPNYNLPESGAYIDYINVMTYHMISNSGYYQSPLYPRTTFHNPAAKVGNTATNSTISDTVRIYNNTYLVPSHKLIIGVPFYGIKQVRSYNSETNTYGNWVSAASLGYDDILFELERPGTYHIFDEISKVPYVINDAGTLFVSFEDEESIAYKGAFVLDNNLAGLMYWEYSFDYNNILLKAMVNSLPKS